MSGDNQSHGNGSQEEALKGWDKGAFWYPTLDRRGALLAIAALLVVLHFDGLLGLYSASDLIAGWLPVHFAYHVFKIFLHLLFMVLLFLSWPEPTDRDVRDMAEGLEEPGAVGTPAEGD